MTIDASSISDIADRLADAARTLTPCPPVRDTLVPATVETAYRVQSELVARRVRAGAVRVGRKVGLTSPVVQKQLGVDQPDFGVLFDDMRVADGARVPADVLLQPKVEGEIAFVLGTDLVPASGTELELDAVRAAVATAHCAIEIVDSRIADWKITIVDTVADNASSGLFTVSATGVELSVFEPVAASMRLSRNGEVVSSGDGRACLGDPLNAVLWLARAAVRHGDPLRAGDIVLSGALGPMVAVTAGDTITVEIDGLGTTSVAF